MRMSATTPFPLFRSACYQLIYYKSSNMITVNAYNDETSTQREKFIDPAAGSCRGERWSGEGDGVGRELGGLRRAHRRSAAGPARHRLRAARPFRGLPGRPRLGVHVKKVRRRRWGIRRGRLAVGMPGPAPRSVPAGRPRPSPQGAAGGIRRGRPRGAPSRRSPKGRSPDRERDRNRQSGSDRAVVSPSRRARRGSSSLRGPRRLSYHARGSRSGDSRIRPAARRGSLTSAWPCGRTGGAGIPVRPHGRSRNPGVAGRCGDPPAPADGGGKGLP